MSNLRMVDLSGVGVFLDNENYVAIPKQFKDNNSLSMVSQKMTEYVISKYEQNPGTPLTAEQILKYLSDYQKEESGIPYFAMLEGYANDCSRGFKETQSTLKTTVFNTVKELSTQIHESMQKHLQTMGVAAILEQDEVLNEDGDFEEWDWDETMGDTSTLLDTLFIDTNVTQLGKMDIYLCKPMMNHLKMDVSETVSFPDETKINMIKRIVELTSKDSDAVAATLAIITDRPKYHHFMFSNFKDTEQLTPFATCEKFKNTLMIHHAILEDIEGMDLDIEEDSGAELKARVKQLLLACDIMRYYLMCRRQYFSNSLLLNIKVINKDQKEAFLKDHTISDLNKYVKVSHVMKKIPMYYNGVSIDTVAKSKDRCAGEYLVYQEDIKLNKHVYKNKALTLAVSDVIRSYLSQVDATLIPRQYNNKQQYIEQMVLTAKHMLVELHNVDGNVEDFLYRFMMMTQYNNTSIANMYKAYQMESVAATESMQDGVMDPTQVEAKVCSKFVTNFFKSNFMK